MMSLSPARSRATSPILVQVTAVAGSGSLPSAQAAVIIVSMPGSGCCPASRWHRTCSTAWTARSQGAATVGCSAIWVASSVWPLASRATMGRLAAIEKAGTCTPVGGGVLGGFFPAAGLGEGTDAVGE